jgi:hypothetical protein
LHEKNSPLGFSFELDRNEPLSDTGAGEIASGRWAAASVAIVPSGDAMGDGPITFWDGLCPHAISDVIRTHRPNARKYSLSVTQTPLGVDVKRRLFWENREQTRPVYDSKAGGLSSR